MFLINFAVAAKSLLDFPGHNLHRGIAAEHPDV
jgi:hypothetical protein